MKMAASAKYNAHIRRERHVRDNNGRFTSETVKKQMLC